MGWKKRQKKIERKAKQSAEMGKVTCTTCRRKWDSKDDYESCDNECGRGACPQKTVWRKASEKLKQVSVKVESVAVQKKPVKGYGYSISVSTGTVLDEFDNIRGQEPALYEEVPKVMAVELRRIHVQ